MNKFAHLAGLAAALSVASFTAQAQSAYLGLGAPGLVTLGYAQPMGKAYALGGEWGVRGEFAGGITASDTITEDGNTFSAKIKANRLGAYADWFPMESNFRMVGGLTFNDIKFALNTTSTGNVTINNKTASLSGKYFNVDIKYPQVAPYLGIGWGHKASPEKGLGFFADVGVSVASFKATVSTNLIGTNGITQADVDAEAKSLKDAVAKMSVLPSVALGVTYRF